MFLKTYNPAIEIITNVYFVQKILIINERYQTYNSFLD